MNLRRCFRLMEMPAKQRWGKLSIFNENGLIVKMRFPIMQALLPLLLVFGGATAHAQTANDSTRFIVFHHGRTRLDRPTRHLLDSLAAVLNSHPEARLEAFLNEKVPCFPHGRNWLSGFPRINNIYDYLAARKTDSTDRLRFAFTGIHNSDTVALIVSTGPDPWLPATHPDLRRSMPVP